jgi:catechol 2,3-dioxygenase-like lactoylglutathione lyase family enzyme
MFSHVSVSVSDFDRALRFYDAVMGSLGVELRFCDRDIPWAGWHSGSDTRPFFAIRKPFNGQPHDPGNGQMTAFAAASRAVVRASYQTALNHGGSCEGPPGLRPRYHENYYGAYFRDPDGNRLCVAIYVPMLGDAWAIP